MNPAGPERPRVGENAILLASAPEPDASTDDRLRLLQKFLARLDELDLALVILYLDGNRHDTIAEVLGISVSNVGTKIGRLKIRLRRERVEHQTEDHQHGTR